MQYITYTARKPDFYFTTWDEHTNTHRGQRNMLTKWLILCLLPTLPCTASPFGVDLGLCSDSQIRCPCGQQTPERHSKVDIPIRRCSYFHRYKVFCKPCQPYDVNLLCDRFQHCDTCIASQDGGCKTCPSDKYGYLCENECQCRNGGICNQNGSCRCPEMYGGPKCEEHLECPCMNGGKCDANDTCVCLPEYEGSLCQNRKARRCTEPPAPPYGDVYTNGRTTGSVARFSCPDTHVMIGSKTSVCLASGHWSHGAPMCEYQCTVPEPGDNIRMRVIPTTIRPAGTTQEMSLVRELQFSCRPGFAIHGEENIRCLPNGVWNANFPSCVQSCGSPPRINYGIQRGDNYLEGSTVTYECDVGYKLNGNSTLVCVNGEWSANNIPTCVRWVQCQTPGSIAHGMIHVNDTTHNVGSSIRYSCDANFRLEGGPDVRICSNEGFWTGQEPWCVRDVPDVGVTCTVPEVPDYGVIIDQQNVIAYIAGIRVNYACNNGYILIGDKQRICTEDGVWTGNVPRCVEVITCSDPGIPRNAIRLEINPKLKYGRGSRLPSILRKSRKRFGRNSVGNNLSDSSHDLILPDGKFRVYTKLKFNCESQFYKLVGSRTRRCSSSGHWTGRQPVCVPICGKSATSRQPLIYNGTISDVGEWPWQVAISHKLLENYWYIGCGGSLISERLVVTAAHCVTQRGTSTILSTTKLKVYLGKHYRDDKNDDQHVQIREVLEIDIHPDYTHTTFDYDIAVLRLSHPVTLTERVSPVCLPNQYQSEVHLRPGTAGVVTGWGRTEDDEDSLELRMTAVKTITNNDCVDKYARVGYPQTITGNMFCAGRDDGSTDSCEGDSGGPLVFPQDSGSSRTWFLEGIVSWGSPLGCGVEMQYGVYTKISHCLEWLRNYI